MLGQTISHFQILDKLGEGGMGVVYKARDLKLDRAVALKFLPRHLSENGEEKERFIQEAKAASALDHPNICTIHEIDETDDGQLFIAMAAYEGETIKQKIRRGALPAEEVIELGIQMTAGLAAAHGRGIIHRDVKPANFMVTPDGVVKILDFGLSKLTNAPAHLTQTGTLMGTAAYMSPEQVQGEVVDQQTDVWALGVVLYEMATGTKPFRGSNDLSTLYRIVHQDPETRSDSGRLPSQLRGILRRALSKERNRRYATITELQADLERLRADTQSASLPPFLRRVIDPAQTRAERVRRVQLLTAAAAVVLAVIVVGVLRWQRSSAVAVSSATKTAAWLGFQPIGESTAPDWLAVAFSELLLCELSDQAELRWVRASLPAQTKVQAEGAGALGFSDSVLQRLRDGDHASLAVAGFLSLDGGDAEDPRLRIELWVQETRRGAVVERFTKVGKRSELLELSSQLIGEVGRVLGIQPLPAGDASRPTAGDLPTNPTAAGFLAQALERLRQLDAPQAKSLAERGLELDPQRGSLHVALTSALLLLGQEREAREHAGFAMTAARRLPRETRLLYLASQREAEGELPAAAALLRLLAIRQGPPPVRPIDPDRFDRDLRLASLLALDDREEDAKTLLEGYREVIPDDPRLLLVDALVARQEGDNRRQRDLAVRAAEVAEAHGAQLLLARARFFEGEAKRRLLDLDGAETALKSAREIYVRAGHARGEGDVLQTLGNVSYDRQDLAAAQTYYEAAARLYGTIGNDRMRNRALSNQALILQERGGLQAALEVYQEVRSSFHAAGDLAAESIALVAIGEIHARLGRFSEAAGTLDEALEMAERSGNPILTASALSANAELVMMRGELAEAERKLRKALEDQEQSGDLQYAAEARSVLALVRFYQGDLVEAEQLSLTALASLDEKHNPAAYSRARRGLGEIWRSRGWSDKAGEELEESLASQDLLGSPRAAETRLSLACWWLDAGQYLKAASLANEALDEVLRRGEKLLAARARCLLAEVWLGQGKLENALNEIALGREQLEGIDSPVYSWPLDLAAARLDVARGDFSQARMHLQSLLADTTTAGFLEQQLETRLVLAELELKAGGTRGARVRLEQLAGEAEQKGFGRLAKKAKQSLIDIPLN